MEWKLADARKRLLGHMLEESHLAAPDDLAALVAREACHGGCIEALLYLTDYEQSMLMPLRGEGVPAREPLQIDTTLAGRAFQTIAPLQSDEGPPRRVWLPLLDGTARVGVLELVVDEADELDQSELRHFKQFASLVAELVVAKSAYGDLFTRARRSREMTLAAEVQWSLLPPLTFATDAVVVTGLLQPSYEIGGDTFDYAVNGDVIHLAILDAMGHGFEAALLATAALSVYRHGRRRGLDLVDTYREMDAIVASRVGQERFLTAQLGELDLRTGDLRWLNAGHPVPLLVRDGRVVKALACAPTLPIGLGGDVAEIAVEALEPGDRLLFVSDGVLEARTADGSFFGEGRLADFVAREASSRLPPPETLRRLSRAILAHQGGRLQDDATMLLVEYAGTDQDEPPL